MGLLSSNPRVGSPKPQLRRLKLGHGPSTPLHGPDPRRETDTMNQDLLLLPRDPERGLGPCTVEPALPIYLAV